MAPVWWCGGGCEIFSGDNSLRELWRGPLNNCLLDLSSSNQLPLSNWHFTELWLCDLSMELQTQYYSSRSLLSCFQYLLGVIFNPFQTSYEFLCKVWLQKKNQKNKKTIAINYEIQSASFFLFFVCLFGFFWRPCVCLSYNQHKITFEIITSLNHT